MGDDSEFIEPDPAALQQSTRGDRRQHTGPPIVRPDHVEIAGRGYDPGHPSLRTIRLEAGRLPRGYNHSIADLEAALLAEAGTPEFDDRLEDFCVEHGLVPEPIEGGGMRFVPGR